MICLVSSLHAPLSPTCLCILGKHTSLSHYLWLLDGFSQFEAQAEEVITAVKTEIWVRLHRTAGSRQSLLQRPLLLDSPGSQLWGRHLCLSLLQAWGAQSCCSSAVEASPLLSHLRSKVLDCFRFPGYLLADTHACFQKTIQQSRCARREDWSPGQSTDWGKSGGHQHDFNLLSLVRHEEPARETHKALSSDLPPAT